MENEFTLWKALENLKNFPRVSIGMETLNLSFRDNLQNPFSLFHRVFPGLSVGFSPVSIGMENFPKGCRSVGLHAYHYARTWRMSMVTIGVLFPLT